MLMKGKTVLILGLASKRSIAYGVAQALSDQGATLALSYQNDRLKSRVEDLAAQFNTAFTVECDVSDDAAIQETMTSVKQNWASLDGMVHSIAYAPADQLEGGFVDTVTRAGFTQAHEISSYSFAALAQAAKQQELLHPGSSLLTMTYIGSVRAIPCYNTMGVAKASLEATMRYLAHSMGPDGIRVNAISAGPIRTLAASGIKHFRDMLDYSENTTPLKRNVSIEEVGQSSVFLLSDMASGVTGHTLYVDAGFHCVGMGEIGA